MKNNQRPKRIPQAVQLQRHEGTQRDEATQERDSYDVNNPHVFSPANILRLQRTIGNQAVLRMADRKPAHIQRDPEEEAGAAPTPATGFTGSLGNVYERKFEVKGDRYSFSAALAFSKTVTSPLNVQGEDGLRGQVGESKVSRTTSYSKGAVKTANSMAFALTRVGFDTDLEILPGVPVRFDMKALEAKLEAKDIDFDIFKVSASVDGALTSAIQGTELGDAILATSLGEVILDGNAVRITLRGEIRIDPADVARLLRMRKLSQDIAKNARAGSKIHEKVKRLTKQSDALIKEGNWKKLAKVDKKLAMMEKKLAENINASKVLTETFETTAQGLKTKGGRMIGLKVASVAGGLLARSLPVVGWVLTAIDVGTLLYSAYKAYNEGQLSSGSGGDEGSPTGTEPEGVQNEGTTSGDGEADASDDVYEMGAPEGSTTTGETASDTGDGMADIDISEDMAFEPANGAPGKAPEMHGKAADVLAAMKEAGLAEMSADDLAQLNAIVPKNMTQDELTALVEWVKEAKSMRSNDPFELLGALQDKVTRLQDSDQDIIVLDEEGQTEQVAEADVMPEDEAAANKAADEKIAPPEQVGETRWDNQWPTGKTQESDQGPTGEKEDENNVNEIVETIRYYKGLIDAGSETYYLGVPPDYKKGMSYNRWFVYYGSAQVYAAYTKITIVKCQGRQITVKISPASVYVEDGRFLKNEFKGTTMKLTVMADSTG